jgi:hypothetical protein
VGAGLTFADDLFRYFAMDVNGWARLTVERKLDVLHDAAKQARAEHDGAALDRVLAEYRRLQITTA